MEKRNMYMKKLEENLAEYNAKLSQMKAKVAEVQDDMKAEYLTQVKNLETKRDDLALKFGQLKESTGQAWDDVKDGTEKTWHELKASVEKAIAHFK
jgi:F0F1-type ATP synthase membrane subunit b/b'